MVQSESFLQQPGMFSLEHLPLSQIPLTHVSEQSESREQAGCKFEKIKNAPTEIIIIIIITKQQRYLIILEGDTDLTNLSSLVNLIYKHSINLYTNMSMN